MSWAARVGVLGLVLCSSCGGALATQTAVPGGRPDVVADEVQASSGPYDRDAWAHWVDADGDCQDTRAEVLIRQSDVPVTLDRKGCDVLRGRWTCPYTLEVFTDPGEVDIDHLVPLQHAHGHGGGVWSAERRRDYANDLVHTEHLVAVSAHANRSKGARGIDAWLPEDPDSRCHYVEQWVAVKRTWGLRVGAREAEVLERYQALCAEDVVLPLPQATEDLEAALGLREREAAGACCKVCRKGKACGDTCIATAAVCTKPPGCAC